MSVAKGLCLALGIPLVAVPSLQVTAYAAGDPGCPVLAAVEAGRGRLCVARFAYSEGIPVQQGPTELEAVNTWAPDLAEPVLLTGEIDAALAERLSALPGAENLAMVSPAGSLRRAGYLAELGWDRFQRGETDDLDTTEPLYLQQPLSGSA
jgi:tRNA threonylcarbamoyladenosine biosynthesis protein TsaB